jgi:uncharacterized protein YdiU (UPF0061 family)
MDELLHAKLGLTMLDEHRRRPRLFDDLFVMLPGVDFTLFFRRLSGVRAADASGDEPLRDLFIDRPRSTPGRNATAPACAPKQRRQRARLR